MHDNVSEGAIPMHRIEKKEMEKKIYLNELL
jgi:hypothetical protein